MKRVTLPMTEAEFILHTGLAPTDDDLERVNCESAGEVGHSSCGWNHCYNMPNFMVSRHHTPCTCKE
ncbi:hypothetical protein KASIA_p011 [Shewanella phage vB_SspS_KASIA]|nr:hypothetical protein KASIA_p011 [Shewanella phage vB_SspS_KASIA]